LSNRAVPGQLASILMGAPTAIDVATLNATTGSKMYTVMIGTNDNLAGVPPATNYANILNIVAQIQATGTPVVVFTILPRGDSGDPPATEANRQALNALILAGAAANGYAVANAGADPIMGNLVTCFNTKYYVDTVHPTVLGSSILSSYVVTAIRESISHGNVYTQNPAMLVDDDYGQIVPYYTTAGFVSDTMALALNISPEQKQLSKVTATVSGTGGIQITVFRNVLTNPSNIVGQRTLANPANNRLEWNAPQKAQMHFFQFMSYPIPSVGVGLGNQFNLKAVRVWMHAPRMKERGAAN
jgi:hypothetical protein